MLLAEEYLLLALAPDSGKVTGERSSLDLALAGALLVELALRERIRVADDDEPRSERGRVSILLDRTTEDALLDEVLAAVKEREGKRIKDILGRWSSRRTIRPWREALLQRLVGYGAITRRHGTVLGLFPTTTYPEADPRIERAVRVRLDAALIGSGLPDTPTAALISLLHATKLLKKVVSDETDKRAAERRAKQIAESQWAGRAVKKCIDDINAAAIGAVSAAGAAAAAGS